MEERGMTGGAQPGGLKTPGGVRQSPSMRLEWLQLITVHTMGPSKVGRLQRVALLPSRVAEQFEEGSMLQSKPYTGG